MCTAVPTPGWLTISMGQPKRSESRRTMLSPTPWPTRRLPSPRTKGRNISSIFSAAIPTPVSRMLTLPSPISTTTPPASVYENAFRSRLPSRMDSTFSGASRNTRCVLRTSAATGLSVASSFARSTSSAMRSLTQMASMGRPVSDSRASSRKAFVSSSMSWQARWMRCAVRRRESLRSGSSSRMLAAMRITVSGLRSS